MIQIEDVVVSFDVLREKFLCNLDACKGECCIEGDAGAPVELDEVEKLEEVLPIIWEELSPEARAVIEKQGVVYTDQEGDLVTSIVNNKDCVFTCYDEKGCCYCAIEKAYRDGKTDFYKPVSCHLYPIRIGDYGPYKAVNYHRWDVCKAAVLLGKKENVAVYQFLKEPLIRKFGEKWYQELEVAVKELNFLHLKKDASKLIVSELEKRLKQSVMHKDLGRQVSYQYLLRLESYKLIKHLIGEKEYEGFRIWW